MGFNHFNRHKKTEYDAYSSKELDSVAQKPSKYEVIMLRESYAANEITIDVLVNFFHKRKEEALRLSIELQQKHQILCGTFTRDIAETKILDVAEFLQKQNFSIKCIMQKERQHAVKKP